MDTGAEAEDAAPAVDRGLLLDPPRRGFAIEAVSPGTPADRAGIRAGDRLLRIDHALPRNRAALRRALGGTPDGSSVFVELERGKRRWGTLLGG